MLLMKLKKPLLIYSNSSVLDAIKIASDFVGREYTNY